MLFQLFLLPLALADLDTTISQLGYPNSPIFNWKPYHPYQINTVIRTECLEDARYIKLSTISHGIRLADCLIACETGKCISQENGLATCSDSPESMRERINRKMDLLDRFTSKRPYETLLFTPISNYIQISAIYCSKNEARVSYSLGGVIVGSPLVFSCQYGCEPGFLKSGSGGCIDQFPEMSQHFQNLLAKKGSVALIGKHSDSTWIPDLQEAVKELSTTNNQSSKMNNGMDDSDDDDGAYDDLGDYEFLGDNE